MSPASGSWSSSDFFRVGLSFAITMGYVLEYGWEPGGCQWGKINVIRRFALKPIDKFTKFGKIGSC